MSKRLLLGLLVAGVAVGARAQPDGERPPPLVVTAPVERAELAPRTWVAATVVSRSDARLSAEAEGRLLEVKDVGTRVDKGDPVARIEDTALQLRARELRAEVARARAQVTYLNKETERLRGLEARKLTAENLLAETLSQRDVARAELDMAEAQLDQVEDQLSRTRLSAPFAGVVVERMLREGERVSVGDAVVRLKDPEDLEVVARPPLDYIQYVARGDRLPVRMRDRRAAALSLPVRTVVSLGSQDTHAFEIRLDAAPEQALVAGQTVQVGVPMDHPREVTAIPRDALVLRADATSVYVVDADGTARRVIVQPGVGDGKRIGVQGPLQPGQQVIIRGNERLQPGQKVRVSEGSAEQSAAQAASL